VQAVQFGFENCGRSLRQNISPTLSIPPTPALSQEIRIYGDIRILKKGA